MTGSKDTSLIANAAANASIAAREAATAAAKAAENAAIAAKAAAESATAIAVVATDTSWMKKSLSRVEESLTEMSRNFVTSAQHADVVKSIDDHETRLNSLETEKTRVTLLLAVSGFILSSLVALLVYHIFQSGV
jgi:hypothetical protein